MGRRRGEILRYGRSLDPTSLPCFTTATTVLVKDKQRNTYCAKINEPGQCQHHGRLGGRHQLHWRRLREHSKLEYYVSRLTEEDHKVRMFNAQEGWQNSDG